MIYGLDLFDASGSTDEFGLPVDSTDSWRIPSQWKDAIEQVMREEFQWNQRFTPKLIRVTAEYAMAVEYGTGPAKTKPSENRPEKGSKDSIYRRFSPYSSKSLSEIRGWVSSKLGIRDPIEWERVSYMIWHKIMSNGKPPSPFARPAMDDAIEAIDNGQFDFADDSVTSDTIAAWLVSRMYYYIDNPEGQVDSGRNMPTNWTGHLKRSIIIDDAPAGYPTISIDIIEDMDDVVVRDSTTLGYNQKQRMMER